MIKWINGQDHDHKTIDTLHLIHSFFFGSFILSMRLGGFLFS